MAWASPVRYLIQDGYRRSCDSAPIREGAAQQRIAVDAEHPMGEGLPLQILLSARPGTRPTRGSPISRGLHVHRTIRRGPGIAGSPAINYAPNLIDRAHAAANHLKVGFAVGDGEQIPFRDDSF
jgi:hypothetical protein